MPGTRVLLLLSYGFLITSIQVKSQTLHFITEEIKVQRWEVVCTPHTDLRPRLQPHLVTPPSFTSSLRGLVIYIQVLDKNCSTLQQNSTCVCESSVMSDSDPMDCSPSGFSVHGILQASILEWVSILLSRGSSSPRDWTRVSCVASRFFYHLSHQGSTSSTWK